MTKKQFVKKAVLIKKVHALGRESEGLTKAELEELIDMGELEDEKPVEVEPVVEPEPEPEVELVVPASIEVRFRKDFVGYIGGTWYRVKKGIAVTLPADVVGRFKASGMVI